MSLCSFLFCYLSNISFKSLLLQSLPHHFSGKRTIQNPGNYFPKKAWPMQNLAKGLAQTSFSLSFYLCRVHRGTLLIPIQLVIHSNPIMFLLLLLHSEMFSLCPQGSFLFLDELLFIVSIRPLPIYQRHFEMQCPFPVSHFWGTVKCLHRYG